MHFTKHEVVLFSIPYFIVILLFVLRLVPFLFYVSFHTIAFFYDDSFLLQSELTGEQILYG